MSGMPEAIRREIAAMGANFSDEINGRTRAVYAPLVPVSDASVETALDLPYGSHPRQRLDIYHSGQGTKKPVLLYVPGGGFVAGDKRSDDRFYGNIGRWFARRGIVAVTMNYRLAPEAAWPAGGEDVGAAVAWLHAHASEYGGDPGNIIIFGQSAGAAHVAGFLFHPEIRRPDLPVARAVLASGPYAPSPKNTPANIAAYYGSDTSLYAYRAPLSHVGESRVPLLLTYTEFDPPALSMPTLELASAVTKRDGKSPKLFYLDGHNHVSNVLSFGTGDDRFGDRILAFIAEPSA